MKGADNTDIAVAVLTLSYSAVLNELLPEAVHVPANLAAAGTVLALARRAGASMADLGLETGDLRAGARTGLAVAAPIAMGITLAARAPASAPHFSDARVSGTGRGRAAYETAVRIPIGTALGEELLFRGALLALFARRYSTTGAVAVSSVLFGVWHVLPTLHSVVDNAPGGAPDASHAIRRVAGTVAATAAAGIGLSMLRLRSRSILAPVIVHAAVNAGAFIATRTRTPRHA